MSKNQVPICPVLCFPMHASHPVWGTYMCIAGLVEGPFVFFQVVPSLYYRGNSLDAVMDRLIVRTML